MARMTGGQAVVAALRAQGVQVAFGIPGVHNLAIYDALYETPAIRHVVARHEQGAGFAADGYARATGRPGVAITTTGPGATNALTAIAEAWSDSSPVLLIASHIDTPYVEQERGFVHELPGQLDLFGNVTCFRARPMRVEDVAPAIAEAFRRMQSGRARPAMVQIPQDVLNASADVEIPKAAPVERRQADPAAVRRAAELLARARRPAIYAGSGVHAAGAHAELLQLAETLGAPVFTTSPGKGAIPEDHPLALGNRWVGEPELLGELAESDVLLAVGTRLGASDTSAWKVRLPARLIHVDVDPAEAGRNYPAELALVGDGRAVLGQILGALGGQPTSGGDGRANRLGALRRQLDEDLAAQWPAPIGVLADLRAALDRDAIMYCDSLIQYWVGRHFPVYAPRTCHFPWTYGTLGSSLPMAIGAKVAFPERQVVVVMGDGALMFTLPELATAVQAGAAIVVVVCNDRGYGAMRVHQQARYGRQIAVDLATPDFAAVAEAFGANGYRLGAPADLRPALAAALASGRPTIIDLPLALKIPWR